jgi:hypothetical protein
VSGGDWSSGRFAASDGISQIMRDWRVTLGSVRWWRQGLSEGRDEAQLAYNFTDDHRWL